MLGDHWNSIAANLDKLPPEVQARYYKNRAQFEGDADAMERWATSGFQPASDDDENYIELD